MIEAVGAAVAPGPATDGAEGLVGGVADERGAVERDARYAVVAVGVGEHLAAGCDEACALAGGVVAVAHAEGDVVYDLRLRGDAPAIVVRVLGHAARIGQSA